MLETKDPAIKFFRKTISVPNIFVGSSDSAKTLLHLLVMLLMMVLFKIIVLPWMKN